jgi:hypothetical protein
MSEDAHSHEPPGLPEIRDEAANTPLWVPALGLALLVVLAMVAVLRSELGGPPEITPEAPSVAIPGSAEPAAAEAPK